MSIPKKYLTEKVILTEAYVEVSEILKILTQSNPADVTDPKYTYYKKLADWTTEKHRQQNLKDIRLDTIALSDEKLFNDGKLIKHYTTLGHLLEALKNLMKQEGKYNPNDAYSNLIQKTTLEILVGLSGIKDSSNKTPDEPTEPDDEEESEDDSTDKPKLYQGMDWTAEKARRLNNPEGKTTSEILDQFYNDYYKIEYAGLKSSKDEDASASSIVAKLKSLDKILIQEFTKLGYNPVVNPLAQFLKILIEKKRGIFNKLNTNSYGAIHNSFINQSITGNMLGNYNDKNILFCDDLYNYKGLDIVKYLSLQKQTLKSAEASSKYSDDPWLLISKMFIQQEQLADTYEKNIEELLKPGVTADKIRLPGEGNRSKMRSELEISEMYNHIFKTVPKKELTISIADELSANAEEQKIMLSMIRYLLDLDRLTELDQSKYEEWFKNFNYTRNGNEENISKSKKMLSDYIINDKTIRLMLSKLKTRVEVNKRKDAKVDK